MPSLILRTLLASHSAQVVLRLLQLPGEGFGAPLGPVPENPCKEKSQALRQADVKALMQEDYVLHFLLQRGITPEHEVGM